MGFSTSSPPTPARTLRAPRSGARGLRDRAAPTRGTLVGVPRNSLASGLTAPALAEIPTAASTEQRPRRLPPDRCNRIVVGSFLTSNGESVPLVERWDGVRLARSWRQRRAAVRRAPYRRVMSLAARCRRGCCQAGTGATRPFILVERWDGGRWSIQRTDSAPYSQLQAVSCSAARACVAVGTAFIVTHTVDGTGCQAAIATRQTGSAWDDPGGEPAERERLWARFLLASRACRARHGGCVWPSSPTAGDS